VPTVLGAQSLDCWPPGDVPALSSLAPGPGLGSLCALCAGRGRGARKPLPQPDLSLGLPWGRLAGSGGAMEGCACSGHFLASPSLGRERLALACLLLPAEAAAPPHFRLHLPVPLCLPHPHSVPPHHHPPPLSPSPSPIPLPLLCSPYPSCTLGILGKLACGLGA